MGIIIVLFFALFIALAYIVFLYKPMWPEDMFFGRISSADGKGFSDIEAHVYNRYLPTKYPYSMATSTKLEIGRRSDDKFVKHNVYRLLLASTNAYVDITKLDIPSIDTRGYTDEEIKAYTYIFTKRPSDAASGRSK